jgi:hypothetical protein
MCKFGAHSFPKLLSISIIDKLYHIHMVIQMIRGTKTTGTERSCGTHISSRECLRYIIYLWCPRLSFGPWPAVPSSGLHVPYHLKQQKQLLALSPVTNTPLDSRLVVTLFGYLPICFPCSFQFCQCCPQLFALFCQGLNMTIQGFKQNFGISEGWSNRRVEEVAQWGIS